MSNMMRRPSRLLIRRSVFGRMHINLLAICFLVALCILELGPAAMAAPSVSRCQEAASQVARSTIATSRRATSTSNIIRLHGAAGSGPFEAVKDWMAAFESRYPEADFSVSSVGSGAAQSALWGDVDCAKKPVEGLCGDAVETNGSGETNALATKTVWGIGGGTIDSAAYAEHSERGLQQLPAIGGPIIVVYSKDVTGDLGSQTSKQLNMSLETIAGIFNNTIDRWDHPALQRDNPELDLPSEKITVLVRSDKSGMSQTFTEAIKHAVPSWPDDGVGKTPVWPLMNLTDSAAGTTDSCSEIDMDAPSNFKADGQTGIGIGLLRRPYSIGYLELGYYSTLTRFASQAYVSSPSHPTDYEPATAQTIKATMDGLVDELEPDTLSLTLVDNPTPLGGYSISRYVYWYIKTSPYEYDSCYQAWLLYEFIKWTYTDPLAEEIALGHGWVTVPGSVVERALAKLNEVQCIDEDTDDIISVSTFVPLPYRPQTTSEDDDTSIIVLAVVIPVLAVAGILIAAYVHIERKKRSVDSIWAVKADELKFDDPPEIVGRGTFGLVLLAEYRGTQVAVKRVIPPKLDFNTNSTQNSGGRKSSKCSGGSFSRLMMLGEGDATDGIIQSMSGAITTSASGGRVKRRASSEGKQPSRLSTDSLTNAEAESRLLDNNRRVGRRMSFTRRLSSDDKETEQTRRLSLKFDFPEDEDDTDEENNPVDQKAFPVVDEETGLCSGSYDHKLSGSFDQNRNASGLYVPRTKANQSGASTLSGGASGSRMLIRRDRYKSTITKRLRRQPDDYEKLKHDFILEMRHLATLRHPCITTVMGAVINKREEPMLVMEYMHHGSLYDILHNETVSMDGDLLLPILQDIAQGLRFLHSAVPQVIHGDLKAANVLVDSKFRAKVADFGLSQKKEIGATGTPLWMAPELLRGESENTSASDVYSFGIILFETYSRRDPYEGESFSKVITEICDTKINKRPPVPEACPPAVATIMNDCLDGDPDARPAFEELDMRLKRLSVESAEPGDMHMTVRSKKKDREYQNAESLMYEIFPRHIADALREGRKVEPEHHDCVTVFFSDIVGFTNISQEIGALKVANMLDRLYNRFDELSDRHVVFKIETIGDAYLGVTNLVKDQKSDHVKRMAEFSIDVIKVAGEVLVDEEDPSKGFVQVRVGFHTGPVISDVLGTRLPKYSIFGDTVNTSSRMESNSRPGRIHCSLTAANLLMEQAPDIPVVSRGNIRIKGKGEMETYWVNEGKQ